MIGDGHLSMLDMIEDRLKFDQFEPTVIPELERMGAESLPVLEQRAKDYNAALEAEQQLKGDIAEVARLKQDASARFKGQLLTCTDEAAATLSACDAASVASRLRTIQDELTLWQDTEDLLAYVRVPAAHLKSLKSALALREIEELVANISAGLVHARTLNALIQGGVYRADNRVGIISEEVERLRAVATEAGRLTKLAASELAEETARQTATTQMRMANALVTRVEAASNN